MHVLLHSVPPALQQATRDSWTFTGVAKRSYTTSKVRGATPYSRSGAAAERSKPHVQGAVLCFAGAAVKRYPMSKVRETQVRWQVLQEGI